MSTQSAVAGCCSLSAKGHVFAMECAMETLSSADMRRNAGGEPPTKPAIRLDLTAQFAMQLFRVVASFYRQSGVELRGFILLYIGLCDVLDVQMVEQLGMFEANTRIGSRFIDEDFGADVTVTAYEFLSDPAKAAQSLLQDLKFGFDL